MFITGNYWCQSISIESGNRNNGECISKKSNECNGNRDKNVNLSIFGLYKNK